MRVTVMTKDNKIITYENVISFYNRPMMRAMSITMEDGKVQYYKTKEIMSIDIKDFKKGE